MLISERDVLAGFSDQIRIVIFTKLYSFLLALLPQLIFSCFWEQSSCVTLFSCIFLGKVDLVQIIFYSFSKLSCQLMSDYTPYMCSQSKKNNKNKKKLQKIMMKMIKFLKFLESSVKFKKTFSEKYMEVYVLVLLLWKTCKGTHSNHIRLKKMKKNAKNDDDYQIPKIFGISKHILGNIFLKVYKSIYHQQYVFRIPNAKINLYPFFHTKT